MTAPGRLAFGLLMMLAAVLPASMLSAQAPNADAPDLRPTLSILTPAKDDEGLREQAAVGEIVTAAVKPGVTEGVNSANRTIVGEMRGSFAAPGADADFEITLARPEAGRVVVTYTLTWKGKPETLVASHGVRIPFAFGANPRRAKVVAGAEGRPRGEIWWVDQNDMWHIYWMLSDQKERWPLWRLGGIVQESPDRYVIWKANRADTSPLVIDQGKASPGWLDVSDTDHGVTVIWDEMPKRAPCAITVNHPEKMIEVWFHPPSAQPRTAESLGYGKNEGPGPISSTWTFTLVYHDDVFPATQKQEIPRDVYAELLRLVEEQKLWQYVATNYLVPVAGDLDARLRQAVDTGIQPSELLRYFDSGNTWKMQKLCAAVGARYTNDPAANVKAVLDYCSRKAAARKGVDKR